MIEHKLQQQHGPKQQLQEKQHKLKDQEPAARRGGATSLIHSDQIKNFNSCLFQVGGGVSTPRGGYLQPRQAHLGGGKGGGGVGGGEEGKEVLQSLHGRREGGGGKTLKAFILPVKLTLFVSQLGVRPLQNSLDSLLQPGGWPVLKGRRWRGNNFQWHRVTERLNREGYVSNMLVSVKVKADEGNSLNRAIILDQPKNGIAREFLVQGMRNQNVQVQAGN